MVEETLSVPTKNRKGLEGLLRKPKKGGPFPAVIIVSGLGMTLHEWNNSNDEVSKRLVEAGYLTIQFNFDIFYPKNVVRELPLGERANNFSLDFAMK